MKDKKYLDLLKLLFQFRFPRSSELKKEIENQFDIFQTDTGLLQFYIYTSKMDSSTGDFVLTPWKEETSDNLIPWESNCIIECKWYKNGSNEEKEKEKEKYIKHFKEIRENGKKTHPEFLTIFRNLFDIQDNILLSDKEKEYTFLLVSDGELSLFSFLYLLCGDNKNRWETYEKLFELLGFFNPEYESSLSGYERVLSQTKKFLGFPNKHNPALTKRYFRMLSWIKKENNNAHPALALRKFPLLKPGEKQLTLGDILSSLVNNSDFKKMKSPKDITEAFNNCLNNHKFVVDNNPCSILLSKEIFLKIPTIRYNIEGELELRKNEDISRSFFATPLMYVKSNIGEHSTFAVGTIQDFENFNDKKKIQKIQKLKFALNYLSRKKADENFSLDLEIQNKKLEDQLNEIKKHSSNAAETKILSRNFSHHIGSHVMPNVSLKQIKARYLELCGSNIDDEFLDILKSRLDIYITERNEFLCDPISPFKSVLFYSQTIIPFIENVLLQDNLCRSEGLGFREKDGNDIQIQVKIGEQDIKATFGDYTYPDKLPYDGTYYATEKTSLSAKLIGNDLPIALPNTHIIFSILENFIRNTAKHQKGNIKHNATIEEENQGIVKQLIVSIELKSIDEHSFCFTIADNVSKVPPSFLSKQNATITNDKHVIALQDLGIIDFKICAGLLNKKLFKEVDETIFKINRREDGALSYSFRILKPKDICLIGYNKSEPNDHKTFDFYPTTESFIKATKTSVPYQFYLFKETELNKLMQDENNTKLLPYRLLVEKENVTNYKEEPIYWEQDKYGRKYLLTEQVDLTKTSEEILVKCWTQWLKRWNVNFVNKTELVVYSEEKLDGWHNNALNSNVIDLKYGYGRDTNGYSLDINNLTNNYPKVFYDHHGGGLSNSIFPPERSFISSNAYIPFGKNSKDLALISNSKPNKNWLLPYWLIEAGLSKILVIDERIIDIAAKQYEHEKSRFAVVPKGKFWYSKYTENFTSDWSNKYKKMHNIDAYWAANIVIATHLNGISVKPDLFDKDNEHWNKIQINNNTVLTETNFDYLKYKQNYIIDVNQIEIQNYDAIIVHRTFLNDESLKTYWNNVTSEEVLKLLNMHFPLVLITSGGGDVITYKGNFKFISFNEVLQCISVPENIGKQTLINNIYST